MSFYVFMYGTIICVMYIDAVWIKYYFKNVSIVSDINLYCHIVLYLQICKVHLSIQLKLTADSSWANANCRYV